MNTDLGLSAERRTEDEHGDTGTLHEAIDSMVQWQVGPLREWLEARLAGPAGVSAADLSAIEAATWWNDTNTDAGHHLPGWLARIARHRPDALAPFVLYVRFAAMLAWELAWEVRPIIALLDATDTATRTQLGHLEPDHRRAVEGCLELLRFLPTEMRVFARANVGDLDEWAQAADEASAEARSVAAGAASMPEGPARDYVVESVAGEIEYYGSIGQAAAAVAGIPRAGAGSAAQALDAAAARLAAAELIADDVNSSELRSHRMSLVRVRQALEQPWLHVQRGRFTVVCPFGVAGMAPGEVVELAVADGSRWALAGLPVVSVRESLPVSDIWQSVDPLNRSFSGAALQLPDIEIVRDDGVVERTLRPQLWLSSLGNHVLILETDVVDALPAALYDALKVASSDYFQLGLSGRSLQPSSRVDSTQRWDAPSDFALAVMRSLDQVVTARRPDAMIAYGAGRTTGVLIIDRAAAWNPATRRSVALASASDIGGLFGEQVLSHPLDANLTSICQWAQYVDGPAHRVPMAATGPAYLAHTANSTTLAAFGSPSYTMDERRDCFVFAASLEGLFHAWFTELARHNDRVSARLRQVAHSQTTAADDRIRSEELKDFEDTLGTWHVQLQEFIARCRTTLLFIESPTLVQSPVIRLLLSSMLERNGYTDVSRQFLESAESLASDRLETVLHKFRDQVRQREVAVRARRERRAKLLMEALLAGVAVAGMSGVASLIQTGYAMGATDSTNLVVGVVALATLFSVYVWWSNRTLS